MKSAWWTSHASVVRATMLPSPAWVAMMWQTASGRPHSMASETPVKGWRRYLPRALCAAAALAVVLVLEQLADIGEDGAGDQDVHIDRQGLAEELSTVRAASRATCTTARLWAMKLTGQSGTLRVNGMRSRSAGVSGEYSNALSQQSVVFVAQIFVFDPLEFGPDPLDFVTQHGSLRGRE